MFAKAQVVGRLVADPELKKGGDNDVVNFALASNRRFKDDVVDYFDVVAWRQLATNFAAHKKKGDLVLVEGNMEINKWEKDGEKRSKMQIVAQNIVFLPSKNDSKNGSTTDDADAEIPF